MDVVALPITILHNFQEPFKLASRALQCVMCIISDTPKGRRSAFLKLSFLATLLRAAYRVLASGV